MDVAKTDRQYTALHHITFSSMLHSHIGTMQECRSDLLDRQGRMIGGAEYCDLLT